MPAGDIRSKVVQGLAWTGMSQVALQITRLAVAVVIARLLTPAEYGLAAMALVFSSLVLVFSDFALGAALIQRKTLTEADRSTAFWTMAATGVGFCVLGVALSGPVASLYDEPDAQPLLAGLSVSFLITALGATHQSLLLREMSFRRLELLTMAGGLAGGGGAIVVATLDGGAWAIIAQQVITATVITGLVIFATPWRPRRTFSMDSLRSLWGFSGYLVGHRLLFYLHQNADRFLIGRYIGAAALGTYAVAYNLMLIPVGRIGTPLQRVLAPAFSRMQEEPERMAAAWARVVRLVAVVTVPALAGLIVVAPDFIPVVLGDQWAEAIPLIQILAWVGMLQALQSPHIDVLMARGRTSVIFSYSCVFTAAHIIAFVIGLQWGVTGVAIAYAISSTLVEPALTVLTARAMGVSPMVFVRSVTGVFQAAAVMAAATFALRAALVDADVPQFARLVLVSLAGVVIFVPLCAWRVPEVAQEIRGLFRRVAPTPKVPVATPVAGES
jgi:O-antigen/teichoic acid export membrane protein